MANLAPAYYGGLLMVVGCTVDCCRLLALSCGVYAVGLRALVNADEPFQFKFPAHTWGIDCNQVSQIFWAKFFSRRARHLKGK